MARIHLCLTLPGMRRDAKLVKIINSLIVDGSFHMSKNARSRLINYTLPRSFKYQVVYPKINSF